MPVTPLWRRDFPYEAAAEDEVTRREFARYLVLGAGAMAAGNVGIAAWTQLRSINTGEPRPIVALADVAVGEHVPVPLPDARTTRRCCCASATTTSSPSARSARTSAASCYFEAELGPLALPVPRGQLRRRVPGG